jgi:hypothetical protein
VRNVDAAGKCDIETRRQTVHLVQPRRFTDRDVDKLMTIHT